MANKILIGMGTPIVFAEPDDYKNVGGARTHQIDLRGLLVDAARQSDKADMDTGGVSNRFPKDFTVTVRAEFATSPKPDESVDIYWAPSVNATAATANPGGVTGSDSAYTGTTGSTLEESLKDLQLLGKLHTIETATLFEQQDTFRATLPTQFGTLVVVNKTDGNLAALGDELSVTFTPREYEVQ